MNQPFLHSPAASPAVQLYLVSSSDGSALRDLLTEPLLHRLQQHRFGVVVPLRDLSPATADALRLLQQAAIPIVGQLVASNPPSDVFHVRNYPQAPERFAQLRAWLEHEQLHLHAVALRVESPAEAPVAAHGLNLRVLARHLWLAHENVLYPAAGAAMLELCAQIHLAGMEVHSLQVPLAIDDRWAGTTLLQRAFDLVPVPADVELVLSSSNLVDAAAADRLPLDIAALYGEDADGVVIGWPRGTTAGLPAAVVRQVQVAAASTEVIYLGGLDRPDLELHLEEIAHLLRTAEVNPPRHAVVRLRLLRSLLRAGLVLTRFWRPMLAWSGWFVAVLLLLRGRWQRFRRAEGRGVH